MAQQENRYVKLERHGILDRCTIRYYVRDSRTNSPVRRLNRKDTEDIPIPRVFIFVPVPILQTVVSRTKGGGVYLMVAKINANTATLRGAHL